MKYSVKTARKHQVEIDRKVGLREEGLVNINKKEMPVRILETNQDGSLRTVMVDNKVYPVQVEKRSDGFPARVLINGIAYDFNIDKVQSTRFKPPAQNKNVSGTVSADLPGQIMRVFFKEGDQVTKGDVIIILEAMKMENEVTAPKDGVLKSLKAKEGQLVIKGDLLAEID